MGPLLEKEEAVALIGTVEKIGLRFGSTRGMSEFLFSLLAYGIVRVSPNAWEWALALAFIRSALGLWSYHAKPHIDQKSDGK